MRLGHLLNARIYRSPKPTASKSKRTAKTRWHGWAVSVQEARRGCIPSAVISLVHIHTVTYFIMSGCCFYLREVCGGISDMQRRNRNSDRRYPVQRGERGKREQSRVMMLKNLRAFERDEDPLWVLAWVRSGRAIEQGRGWRLNLQPSCVRRLLRLVLSGQGTPWLYEWVSVACLIAM